MTGQASGLDHVGIVGADLAALAESFTRLGFHVTPRADHEGGRTGNHCVMLRGSYLELVSTLPGGSSATLARFLAHHAGAHIIALRIDDEAACLPRLARAGFPGLMVHKAERALDSARTDGPRVGFHLITPPDPPEGRIHLIRHLTADILWRPDAMTHPNHVVSLAEVEIVVADPAVTAAWFSRLTGRPVVPEPAAGGLVLELPEGRIRLRAPRGDEPVTIPWMRRVTLLTDDANAAVRAILDASGLAHDMDRQAVLTRIDDLILCFQPMQAGSDRS